MKMFYNIHEPPRFHFALFSTSIFRFKINPKTGMISSDRDFHASEEYDLSIKAVDNGRPRKSTTTRLRITVEEAAAGRGGKNAQLLMKKTC